MARRTPRITDTGTHLKVELTQGQSALVDYVDRDLVDGVLWSVRRKHYRERTVYYVVRKAPQPNPTGKKCLLHREVGLRLWPDLRSDEYPDHKNKDPLDNRRANLRRATMAQNNQNQRARAGCDSVYKGVTRSKDDPEKWVATIICRLGQFDSEEEAARAYDRAARVLHGDFANLNFPPLPRRPRP